MKSPTCLSITADLPATLNLTSEFEVVFDVVLEVVGVDKILAGVVWWINVDEFDFIGIALLQQLEHFKVIALNHQIFCTLPLHTLFRAGAQGAGGWSKCKLTGFTFTMPVETVLLFPLFHCTAEQLSEHLKINFPFTECFREKCFQLFNIARQNIG